MATTVADDLRSREYEELIDDQSTVREKIVQLAGLVRQHAGRVVVVTGAGISTGAGVPDFRSGVNSVTGLPAGKWCRQATEDKWTEAQATQERMRAAQAVPTTKAVPTPSHMALVTLQKAGILRGVISQNTDGLHRRSGMPPSCLAELHGNSTIEYCGWCGKEYLRDFAASLGRHLSGAALKRDLWPEHSKLPLINPRRGNHYTGRRCQVEGCGGWLFDSTVDFGDDLPEDHFERGRKLADESTLCIVLGSRCSVSPASDLPQSIGESTRKIDGKQKTLVVVNLQRTEVDYCAQLRIGAKIDDVMVALMAELGDTYAVDTPRCTELKPSCLGKKRRGGSSQRSARDTGSGAWPPASMPVAQLAYIPPFVLRRRILVKHTTRVVLQRRILQALDVAHHSAKQMSVAIGKCLGIQGVTKLAPSAIVKAGRAQINRYLQDHSPLAAAVSIPKTWGQACLAAPAPIAGTGKVKSELLEVRDVLLSVLATGNTIDAANKRLACDIGGSKIEVSALDSNGMAADVLWNVQAVRTPFKTAMSLVASHTSGQLSDRDVHVELTHDVKRKNNGKGERGPGTGAAADELCGPARGDIAQVLSYPWEDHGGKGCGYGRVKLKMLSGACATNSVGKSGTPKHTTNGQNPSPVTLTVGADMCAVLDGPSNSGKAQGPRQTHTIQLLQSCPKLPIVGAAATLTDCSATSSKPTGCDDVSSSSSSLDLGIMLCFRAHYGEPPCVLPLSEGNASLDAAASDNRVPQKQLEVGYSAAAATSGEYVQEYLMEWCPGVSTMWNVTKQ